jgi:di/tricarboxylate transporter
VIIILALVFFISGWLRADLIGLSVLSALAITGLVSTKDALSGFSSPAVITVWAMFILSAGLTRTGIAHRLGQPLQLFAKKSEISLIIALMVVASLLSALINTVTVAIILLPTTMELARRSGRPPSRLLMPLALGCMLGGPFTAISTSSNILVSDALRYANLRPFDIFEFTPITAVIVICGIVFMVLLGRHLLPKTDNKTESHLAFAAPYQFDSHIFTIRIHKDMPFEGRTLAKSHLGSALFLNVLAIQRKGILLLAPRPNEVLQQNDLLIVHGNPNHLLRLHGSHYLQTEISHSMGNLISQCLQIAEGYIPEGSPLLDKTLKNSGLRARYHIHVMALYDENNREIKDIPNHQITVGHRLMLQGKRELLEEVTSLGFIHNLRFLEQEEIAQITNNHIMTVRVPDGSVAIGRELIESRLGNGFGLTVLLIKRGEELICMPSPQEKFQADDLLVLQGSLSDLQILEGLQKLDIEAQTPSLAADLESQQIGVTEVLLSPRNTLVGRTLSELLFREQYGLNVLAIWRKGRAYRSRLQDMPLKFGDALLVYGQRKNLQMLAKDPNFIVLDQSATQVPKLEKAFVASAIMLGVLLSAMLGFVPIAIAGIAGATIMVVAGCLTMEEAYRAIDWKVIFLIAGMLPLGMAIENTGIAQMVAKTLIATVGDLGPRWVVAALFVVTVIGIQIIPVAAIVVLMSPVALSTASTLHISPHLLMMTIAIAATCSYASPFSHPANLLIMGPGGYRFTDYLKIGLPLTIVSFVVCIALLPIFWTP